MPILKVNQLQPKNKKKPAHPCTGFLSVRYKIIYNLISTSPIKTMVFYSTLALVCFDKRIGLGVLII